MLMDLKMVRLAGFAPTSSEWQSDILLLNDNRKRERAVIRPVPKNSADQACPIGRHDYPGNMAGIKEQTPLPSRRT